MSWDEGADAQTVSAGPLERLQAVLGTIIMIVGGQAVDGSLAVLNCLSAMRLDGLSERPVDRRSADPNALCDLGDGSPFSL